MFKLKPYKPKYDRTWDVSLVLDEIENWFPLNELNLTKLSYKLVMLLAPVTGHRVQTLSLISSEAIIFSSKGVEINVEALIKTS